MIEHEEIVKYVSSATADVFSTMLGMEVAPKPEHVEETPPMIADGVMALVGLAGTCTGAGVITCGTAFAIQVCNHLLMAEETSVNEDVLDAMGEVANMIIGNFKTLAEEHVGPLCLSIPTVIHGRNFTSRSIGNAAWVVVPFECNGDIMQVRICLAASRDPVVPRPGAFHSVAVLT
jgi:chemotaxis protein CheX